MLEGIALLFVLLAMALVALVFSASSRSGQALEECGRIQNKLKRLGEDVEMLKAELARAPTAVESRIEQPRARTVIPPKVRVEPTQVEKSPPKDELVRVPVQRGPSAPAPVNRSTRTGAIDWERLAGVRLFAWIGGLALFLGISFLVKYSIEQGLLNSLVRVVSGSAIGIGAIVAGLRLVEKYRYTSHALCAAGPAILFAAVYAACHFYQFVSLSVAFFLMIAVTVTMFLLAVHLNSRYIALLGLLGGFLTPVLVSTGQDNPLGLFGYLALLDLGLIAVALKRDWPWLIGLSAVATFIAQCVWLTHFFNPTKIPMAIAVHLLFVSIYVAVEVWMRRIGRNHLFSELSAAAMPILALLSLGFVLVWLPQVSEHPGLAFLFVFLLNAAVLLLAGLSERFLPAQIAVGAATFVWILTWTVVAADENNLYWALAADLVFALLHSASPLVLQRWRPMSSAVALWANAFPLLMFVPILVLVGGDATFSGLIWAGLFAVGLMALMVAYTLRVVWTAYGVLGLMLVAFAVFLGRLEDAADVTGLIVILASFTVAFLAFSLVLERRKRGLIDLSGRNLSATRDADGFPLGELSRSAILSVPVLGVLMPFFLMAATIVRLDIQNPASVFGLGLFLCGLLLGLAYLLRFDEVTPVALGAVLFLEFVWHLHRFDVTRIWLSLPWYLLFAGIFMLYPFLLQSVMRRRPLPWFTAAVSSPLHFFLVYDAISNAWGTAYIGLLPLFCALIGLAQLIWLSRIIPEELASRRALVGLFAAVALFFVTLVLPLQFQKEWLTIGWALEGAALVWLFHRIPHPNLKKWAVGLLLLSFARLAANPAVFSYHPVQQIPIFNWFLYTYGVVTACLALAAFMWRPLKECYVKIAVGPLLYTLAAILLFLWMNIEIADFFSEGAFLTFAFGRSFGQDLTYSLAWALFGLFLLLMAIRIGNRGARLASLILIAITTLKLFFYDLWRLGQLYRVAAFVGLAAILMLVSTLYQKYVSADDRARDPGPRAGWFTLTPAHPDPAAPTVAGSGDPAERDRRRDRL
jgi:uncharacterized membrane protein